MLFLLFSSLAYAQKDSSSVIIRFNGGYADTGSSNGVASLGSTVSNSRDWNVGLTLGLPVGKRWEVGLGFEYWKQKTVALYSIYLPKQWAAMELAETKMNIFIGKVYVAGRWQLFNHLYFNPMLSVGIGKATGTQKSHTAVTKIFTEGGLVQDDISGAWTSEPDISFNYFAISLSPAFSYYFNRHFALNLETGDFRFTTSDWKWDNKQWLANVNPVYWRLGVIITF